MSGPAPKRAALYVRVSTDGQTTANQEQELRAVAERQGWHVVELFRDHGISGKNGREKRPGLHRLLQGVARKDFDVVMVWSVDRLGRSLQDLLTTLSELHAKGCDLYLHQQAIDTTTPSGRAMFQLMGVFAEFERSMIVARINAGLKRARAEGKTLGRPRLEARLQEQIKRELKKGTGVKTLARKMGLAPATVRKVKNEYQ